MKRIEDVAEVMELISCTPFARKIRCRLCGEIVFQVNDIATQEQINAETSKMTDHFKERHQIDVGFHQCSDPNCLD